MIVIGSLTMPQSLKQAAEDRAQDLEVSRDQIIASAMAEKVSALRTVEYLQAGRTGPIR